MCPRLVSGVNLAREEAVVAAMRRMDGVVCTEVHSSRKGPLSRAKSCEGGRPLAVTGPPRPSAPR